MSTPAQLRGYLLEEALAWLLRNSGYRLLVDQSQDPDELVPNGNGLCVKGRGAEHQVDVLGEFAFTPAFSLPIRLFLEAKFTRQKTDLPVVRNAHGVIHDINENFVHGPGQRLRKRFRYVYAIFSAKGSTKNAQDFALAQQISLVDLSGASFCWLLGRHRGCGFRPVPTSGAVPDSEISCQLDARTASQPASLNRSALLRSGY